MVHIVDDLLDAGLGRLAALLDALDRHRAARRSIDNQYRNHQRNIDYDLSTLLSRLVRKSREKNGYLIAQLSDLICSGTVGPINFFP